VRSLYPFAFVSLLVGCTPTAAPTHVTAADVRAASWADRARPHLEACFGPASGKLRVRVFRTPDGKLGVEPEDGFSLDPTEQRCVLQALMVTQDPTAPPWTGATFPPMGSTTLFTLEW
jgi:hypothetical protein